MTHFTLDALLEKDCIVLGMLGTSTLLLMNNSLVPWFILVPHTTKTELVDLPTQAQAAILEEICWLSAFIKNNFNITKLNTAAIGNIVSQLHIHVVGRSSTDFCWPNVVWGREERQAYGIARINEIIEALCEDLDNKFVRR